MYFQLMTKETSTPSDGVTEMAEQVKSYKNGHIYLLHNLFLNQMCGKVANRRRLMVLPGSVQFPPTMLLPAILQVNFFEYGIIHRSYK